MSDAITLVSYYATLYCTITLSCLLISRVAIAANQQRPRYGQVKTYDLAYCLMLAGTRDYELSGKPQFATSG